MGNFLAKGSAWLQAQQTEHCSADVYYVRGASSVRVKATIGQTLQPQDESNGLRNVQQTRDYLIMVADLVLDDIPIIPQPGDRIIEGDLDSGVVYQLASPGGDDCWRYSDPYRKRFRVHTNYVGEQPPQP